MAKRVTLKTETAIDLGLSAIEREVVDSARAGIVAEKTGLKRDVAAFLLASKDGQASKTFSDLFRAATVAGLLGYPEGDAGLIKAQALMKEGVERSKEEQLAILAAGNRLSRRLRAAGLETATPRKPRTEKPKNGKVLETPTLATPTDWAAFLTTLDSLLANTRRKNSKSMDAKAKDWMEDVIEAIQYHVKKSAR